MSIQGVLRSQDIQGKINPQWNTAQRAIRILLIQPPSTGCVKEPIPQVEEGHEGIGYKPPLGILHVASTVKALSVHQVKVIDGIAQQLTFDDIVNIAIDFHPDVIGISAWTDWWYPAYHTGERLKQKLPQTHLVYGGPHLGIFPQETLDVPFIDSVIVGDGEMPFFFLCNMIANGLIDNTFPGLHFKAFGVKPGQETFYIHQDLDSLPHLDRTLLPLEIYGSVLGKTNHVTSLITSRGCPYRCTFCKLNFQKTLCHSAQYIIEEFQRIRDLGIREVEIYDDTFTWSKKRVIEICERLIQEKIDIQWAIRDRVDKADPELLELMRQAGCNRIHYGIESGVDHVLHNMKKHINTNQAKQAIQYAKASGFTVLTYFMFGSMGETEQDIQKTLEFALSLDADYCTFSIVIPYAGTEMYQQCLDAGIIKSDYWKAYAVHPTINMVTQLNESQVDANRLIALQREAIRKFYFRPKYIIRQIKQLSNFSELWRKMKMAGQLFRTVWGRRLSQSGTSQ